MFLHTCLPVASISTLAFCCRYELYLVVCGLTEPQSWAVFRTNFYFVYPLQAARDETTVLRCAAVAGGAPPIPPQRKLVLATKTAFSWQEAAHQVITRGDRK